MSQPTKSGYYWAKFNEIVDPDWEIVRVHIVGYRSWIYQSGDNCGLTLEDFTWGPLLEPPA